MKLPAYMTPSFLTALSSRNVFWSQKSPNEPKSAPNWHAHSRHQTNDVDTLATTTAVERRLTLLPPLYGYGYRTTPRFSSNPQTKYAGRYRVVEQSPR